MSDEKVPTAFGMVTPPPKPFNMTGWADSLQKRVLERMGERTRRLLMFTGIDPDNQPTIGERRPLAPEFLAARAEFEERWKALVEEGESAGFLDRLHCYECGGELAITAATSEVVSVPNPDFDPDKPNPYAHPESFTFTIPRSETS